MTPQSFFQVGKEESEGELRYVFHRNEHSHAGVFVFRSCSHRQWLWGEFVARFAVVEIKETFLQPRRRAAAAAPAAARQRSCRIARPRPRLRLARQPPARRAACRRARASRPRTRASSPRRSRSVSTGRR